MQNIPESHQDLLLDEKKAFVYLATLMKDGSPQATPVWFNVEGDNPAHPRVIYKILAEKVQGMG